MGYVMDIYLLETNVYCATFRVLHSIIPEHALLLLILVRSIY